ncbi:MAG: serine/threonine-protein phosphatase [Chloroflexi bacterium]|nr:serine/threonine-protein phosphatase [Chloroflexota bacterium]
MPYEPFDKLPLPVKRYALLIIGIGLLTSIVALYQLRIETATFLVLIAAITIALLLELMPIEEVFPQMLEFTLTGSIHLMVIATFGYGFAVWVGVASCLIAEIIRHRVWYKGLFNVAVYAITITVASIVYAAAFHPIPLGVFRIPVAFVVASFAYRLSSEGMIAYLHTLRTNERFLTSLVSQIRADALVFTSEAVTGLAAVYLYLKSPAYALIMILPLVALSLTTDKARRYRMRSLAFEAELARAGEVQRQFLPPLPLAQSDLELAFKYKPYDGLSGDFLDVFEVGDQLHLAVGDSAGKGLQATLLAESHHDSLRLLAARHHPAEILEKINVLVYERALPEAFLSMFCARYNLRTSKLLWANAGHPSPIHYSERDRSCNLLPGGGVMLGAQPTASYEESELSFGGNDILVAYTDGVTECLSLEREHYGAGRLQAVVALNCDKSAEEIAEAIHESVVAFSGGKKYDDLTIMVLKNNGGTVQMKPWVRTREIAASLQTPDLPPSHA